MNDWTGTGLDPEVTVKINDGVWNYEEKIKDGEAPVLKLFGVNVDTGTEWSKWFPAGTTWKIIQDGAAVEYTGKGKKQVFNKQTAYGIFLDSFLECEGADAVIKANDIDPTNAHAFKGLTLHLEAVEKEWNIDGQVYTGERVEVREIIQDGDGGGDKTEGEAKVDIPAGLASQLESLARECGTFEEFIDKAFTLDGVVGSAFEGHITDDGADGFYKKNH